MKKDILLSFSTSKSLDLITQNQRQQFLAVGEKSGLDFKFIGIAPIPDQPVYIPGWWIIPAMQDKTEIPARTQQRIQLLFKEGLRPKSFVIVHEVPNSLPGETKDFIEHSKEWEQNLSKEKRTKKIDTAKGSQLSGFPFLSVFVFLFAGLAMIDPILIAITDDNEWIEIDRWNVESR